ncbi:DUF6443 domain-containing protein [Chryseobacterium sp. WG23]|uniref:DUF6443 domain-containing protein n=1 Tax=Chryseobacterium sp. WG23 TaxID=2926910 RepID=UPI00211EA27C|nr:DUF6443 domain-containing protein [Chryseobacterium sp. WG23]
MTITNPNAKQVENIEYLDGFGKTKQIIGIKVTPSGKDIVVPIELDQFGRQTKRYLPIPQSGTQNGAIYTSPLGNAPSIYSGEKIYLERTLENSPLDRIQQQIQVGNDWSNKPVKFDYAANVDGEVIKMFTTTIWENGATKSTIEYGGMYGASQLYKNTVTDEDGNQAIEFKNGKGQTLMVRKVISVTENADTYYVYNEYDQLAWVIPPLLSKKVHWGWADQQGLAYEYRYDGRNRLVEKKLPGKDWEYMVYDKQDRLVGTQDANLRAKGQWMYTKYDQFSRVIMTGICQAMGSTRLEEQNYADTKGNNSETRSPGLSMNYSGMDIYYSVTSGYPQYDKVYNFLSLNYYDTYPIGSSATPSQIQGSNVLQDNIQNSVVSTKGLLTASYVKNTEANDIGWTKNYMYYDTKGRSIGIHSINHLGGYTKTESKLDFAGVPQTAVTKHKRLNTDIERIITENFEYDAQNRLLVHKHQVDSNPVEILAQNTYNELSQLSNKKVGNNLQSIDYAYNIRGWMTKINDPANLNGKLFAYELKYQNPTYSNVSTGKYNGNIAEIDWASSDDGKLKRYNYQYDGLDRLKNGIYSEPNTTVPQNNYYNETLTYDVNGNIQTLKRNRLLTNVGTIVMDNLSYTYTGNKLITVNDTSGNNGGYPSSSGNPITYDNNGNMTSHVDKGMLQIDYNFLNLPDYIKFNRDYVPEDDTIAYKSNTKYLYSAGGIKLRKIYIYGSGRGNLTETIEKTDYLDGFQYDNDLLSFVPTSEGYFDFEKNIYIYNYTDQVGNIRVAYYKDASGNLKLDRTTHYYPFGLEFGGDLSTVGTINPSYRYSSQGQEKQRETRWSSYRWRNYDAAMGRFFNVDPLSEVYAYQSHYNFSENRVVDARELEGLEISKINNPDPNNSPANWDGLSYDGGIESITTYSNGVKETNIANVALQGKTASPNIGTVSLSTSGFSLGETARFGAGFVPILGSGLDIYEGARDGNWVQFGFGVGGLALDVVTLGSGSIIKGGIKTIGTELVEEGIEKAAKEVAEKEVKSFLVPMAEETLEQASRDLPETIGTYSIYGTQGMVGNTYTRNIFLMETSKKSLSGLRSTITTMEKQAAEKGASKISIYGAAVINDGFLNPAVAKRFGYSFEKIGSGTILQKALK